MADQRGLPIHTPVNDCSPYVLRPAPAYPSLDVPPSVPPRPAPPVPSGGVPIDVDTIRKTRPASLRGCYRCREPNHLVKDCPHRVDVRRLTAEQRKELIKDLIALKDAVAEEEVGSSLEEDFV